MRRLKGFVFALILVSAMPAMAQDRDAVWQGALAHWQLGDGGKAAAQSLNTSGEVELGVASEGAHAPVARLKQGYFDAGKGLAVTGNAITVYLRARDPEGNWGTALFAKRGEHATLQFNLFSVDLPGTPGQDIGFEMHTESGLAMLSFPVSDMADAKAWHDFAAVYDGESVRLLCDGKVMGAKAWDGALTQNEEPVLIGAETDHGKVVRPFTGEMEEAALWPRALGDAELAALMRVDSITPAPQVLERYDSPIHYRPRVGRLADTIPFFWKGEYHIFYLRALDKVPWEHIVSIDLIHWKELPTALKSDGAADGPDGMHMFTGSVTEHDGLFHIYYTGWNPANKEGREKIMHATSHDLITWKKIPLDGFFADGEHYDNSDFRDPFIFWNNEDQNHWMVLCARDAATKHPVQAVAKSKDMIHWTQAEPLLLDPPLGEGTPECPDVFKAGDYWRLIHSPSAGTTDMRYAEKPEGPYRMAETSSIDTPILYAAKRMFDGKRHILTGWIRDLGNDRDGGDMQWGGDQSVPREAYPGPEGMLYFRPVPEAVALFTKRESTIESPVHVMEGWEHATPDNYYLDATVRMDPGSEFVLAFRQELNNPDCGYWLTISSADNTAALSGKTFDYRRPARIDTSKPVRIQAFVQGSIIECFINEAYAFSCRAYDYRSGGIACSAAAGEVELEKCDILLAEEK